MIHQIEPWIDEEERIQLDRVIASTFVVEHALTAEFEEMTRELTGAKHAIAMCNGTMALYTCLKALGIGGGDEVIVPNLTFVATANAVILAGAKPVLCEITADTFCIDISRAESLVTRRTKAVVPVHLYGQAADMAHIMSWARRRGLLVLEDAAQGVGVRFDGRHVGTFGQMGVLSYYGNKTITCGEGGVVLTNDDRLARSAYRLKNHGREVKGTFIHDQIGFNFSFTEMQAAVGIAQMKKLSRIKERKAGIYQRYVDQLAGIAGMQAVHIDKRCEPLFWFTSFLVDDASTLAEFLLTKEIQTRRFFYPLHLQPCYQDKKYVDNVDAGFSISELVYRRGLSLPSAYNLSAEDQGRVINGIKEYYAGRC